MDQYRLVQVDPESGWETLSSNPSIWECVKDWELLAEADRSGDYRVEDAECVEVWRNVPVATPAVDADEGG